MDDRAAAETEESGDVIAALEMAVADRPDPLPMTRMDGRERAYLIGLGTLPGLAGAAVILRVAAVGIHLFAWFLLMSYAIMFLLGRPFRIYYDSTENGVTQRLAMQPLWANLIVAFFILCFFAVAYVLTQLSLAMRLVRRLATIVRTI